MSFRILFVDGESSAASEASQSRRFDCPRRCSSCRRSHATRPPIASTEAAPNACPYIDVPHQAAEHTLPNVSQRAAAKNRRLPRVQTETMRS